MTSDSQVHWISSSYGVVVVSPSSQLKAIGALPAAYEIQCILTAWIEDCCQRRTFSEVVERMLQLGCKCFACFGPCSEKMHDEIDVLVEQWCSDHKEAQIDPV